MVLVAEVITVQVVEGTVIQVMEDTMVQVMAGTTEAAKDTVAMIDEIIQGVLIAEGTMTEGIMTRDLIRDTVKMGMGGVAGMTGITAKVVIMVERLVAVTGIGGIVAVITDTGMTEATTMALIVAMMAIADLVMSRMKVAELSDQHTGFQNRLPSEIIPRQTTKTGRESDVQPALLTMIQETFHF